jgi:hypothetical protein
MQGSGGRGGGKPVIGTKNDTFSKKPEERELKFAPVSNKGNTATYDTTKDAVIQHIRKTYTGGIDVGQSLEAMKMVDLTAKEPTRTLTTETDPAKMLVDQKGLDITYQARFTRHLDREDALREGLDKAYNLIFTNYCTKVMQARIEQHPEYETKLKNDPIAVLEAIKALTHTTIRAQYPIVTITDALGRLMNVKQRENETILDYVKRFKQLRDVVKSQMGNKFLDEFVEYQPTYKTVKKAEQLTMKAEVYSKWMAYLLLRGSDQRKYGKLLTDLISQFSLNNDQYPKTIEAASDALSNHRIDDRFYQLMKKKNDERQQQTEPSPPDNESDVSSQAKSFVQQKRPMICYCCGKEGHRSPTCDQANIIPREDWFIKQAMQNLQELDSVAGLLQRPYSDNSPDLNDEIAADNESNSATSTTPSANRRSGTTRPAQSASRDIITWSG